MKLLPWLNLSAYAAPVAWQLRFTGLADGVAAEIERRHKLLSRVPAKRKIGEAELRRWVAREIELQLPF